jgi:hypothetical protein
MEEEGGEGLDDVPRGEAKGAGGPVASKAHGQWRRVVSGRQRLEIERSS